MSPIGPISPILLLCAALATVPLRASTDSVPESKPQRSSDGLFEVYQTPNSTQPDVNGHPFPFGTRLHLRAAGTQSADAIIRTNDRWMDQQWCPGTDLLAVQDCWDTHESDVYVYEVYLAADRRTVRYRLVFRSPWNTVDHLWSFEGWDPKRRTIRLRIEQWGNDDITGHEHWPKRTVIGHYAFQIGMTALHDSSADG